MAEDIKAETSQKDAKSSEVAEEADFPKSSEVAKSSEAETSQKEAKAVRWRFFQVKQLI